MTGPSVKTLLLMYTALLALLALTVGIYFIPMGSLNTILALTIAAAKATIVILYFMHAAYRPTLTRLLSAIGFVWLGIMLTITLSDYLTR